MAQQRPKFLQNIEGLRGKVGDAAKRNLNAVLDAVDAFEAKGGLTGLVDHLQRASLPPGQDKPIQQYYANLEVPYGADLETVKKSYRRLMRQYHPDKHSGDPERERLATALSQELTRAYEVVVEHLRRQGKA